MPQQIVQTPALEPRRAGWARRLGDLPFQSVVLVGRWPAVSGRGEQIDVDGVGVICSAADPNQFQAVMTKFQPAWIVIGLGPDDTSVQRLLSIGRVVRPSLQFAMLGEPDDGKRCERWARRGCRVYLTSSSDPHRLMAALQTASMLGVIAIDHAFYRLFLDSLPLWPIPTLTPREAQVLELLCRGMTNDEVARSISVSPHTVEFHVGHILSKLSARNRAEAISRAFVLGIGGAP
jgi:DNA-binding NarL/FixJ family response regulator